MIEFFSPVGKSVLAHKEILPEGTIGKMIRTHSEKGLMPEVSEGDLAIFGVLENRRDVDYMGEEVLLEGYRKAFYGLYPGNWTRSVVDLGDILPGEKPEDSYFALRIVVEALVNKNIIPIILGGSQDLVYAQYRAYDKVGSMVNLVNVDSNFDLGDADKPISNKSYVGKVIVDEPYNLFNYSVVGYQSFYNPPAEIKLMDRLYFDAYRLGEVTGDITLIEPVMRDADIVSIDTSAMMSSHYDYRNDRPNGFNGREICAISRYAGISNRVSSFGIYELSNTNADRAGGMLVAQIIWYFIEGINFRVSDDDFENGDLFATYKVPVEEDVLVFKKSLKTGRWWVELPFISAIDNKLKRRTLLPCTYGDYLGATNQEIPERWYKARRKNEI